MNTTTIIALSISIVAWACALTVIAAGIKDIANNRKHRRAFQTHINELLEDLENNKLNT